MTSLSVTSNVGWALNATVEKFVGAVGESAPNTCTCTVKLVPVTWNNIPMSPLLLFAVGAAFVTLTIDPDPVFSVSTNLVFTATVVLPVIALRVVVVPV